MRRIGPIGIATLLLIGGLSGVALYHVAIGHKLLSRDTLVLERQPVSNWKENDSGLKQQQIGVHLVLIDANAHPTVALVVGQSAMYLEASDAETIGQQMIDMSRNAMALSGAK